MTWQRWSVGGVSTAMILGTWVVPAAAAVPSNDLRANATTASPLPFADLTTSAEATVSLDDPACRGQGGTVWWSHTATEDERLAADTFGSSIDTVLGVYAAGPGGLTEVGCNDDENEDDFSSEVLFDASAGVTYYFVVSRFNPGGGVVAFNLRAAPRLTTLEVDVSRATLTRQRSVVVSGSATCDSPGAFTFVTLTVTQGPASGMLSFTTSCSPDGVPWTVTVTSARPRFHPGALAVAHVAEAGNLDDPGVQTSGSAVLRVGAPGRP